MCIIECIECGNTESALVFYSRDTDRFDSIGTKNGIVGIKCLHCGFEFEVINDIFIKEKSIYNDWDCEVEGHVWHSLLGIEATDFRTETIEIPVICEVCGKRGREVWVFATYVED